MAHTTRLEVAVKVRLDLDDKTRNALLALGWTPPAEPEPTEQADALRARWGEHFAEHARNGTISPYSPSRVAEDIERPTDTTKD